MTNEEHAREFLEYVANNEARLKKNLKKNITYDDDIFDDVYQSTILKVYDSIMNGTTIDDFEKYFFIASKFNYINEDNKKKKRAKSDDNAILWRISHGHENTHNQVTQSGQVLMERIEDNGDEYQLKEEKNDKINELFKFLASRLSEVYSPSEVDIFLIYYRLKSEKTKMSYKKMAQITNKSTKEIASIIQKIKLFIRCDENIKEKYKKLIKNV